jgi:2-oxo-3-hexenedioate decarboxylase
MDERALREASQRLVGARRERRTLQPLLSESPRFDTETAYDVARCNHDALLAAGDTAAGRKIGFTNRGIWDAYRVYQPIWAHMYASTVRLAPSGTAAIAAAEFCQPRIEPEIIVKLARAPEAADPRAIAESIEWVAHGYEIVQCHFADWKFAAADTIADFGLHAALFVGEPIDPVRIPDLAGTLSRFTIELSCDGKPVDQGVGANVLDGPLHAIAHLMQVLGAQHRFAPLAAGEIITTGTLTAAFPVAAGERWQTRLSGIALPGFSLAFG